MTLERTWLLGTARAEREAMGRRIQYTPPDRWERESALAGWRNRDIVAHLAATEVAAAAAIAGEEPAELEEFSKGLDGEPFSVDAFNQWVVRRRAEEPFRSVVMEWGRAADLFLSRASKVPPDEWGTRRVRWVVGEIGVSYLIQSRVAEWWFHGEDVAIGADLPPRTEHPPIFCVNDLAVRMIPYSLGLAGLSFSGRSVLVDLDSAGGGRWHWSLAPGEGPASASRPDVVIDGRAHAFALVAGRRAPADTYLADGVLQVAGDTGIGEAILEHLRVFPP